MFVFNTFPILENLDAHPAADRLLLDLISYAAADTHKPKTSLPDAFEGQLKKIGYLSNTRPDHPEIDVRHDATRTSLSCCLPRKSRITRKD